MRSVEITPSKGNEDGRCDGSLISYPETRQSYIIHGVVEKANLFWQTVYEQRCPFIVMLSVNRSIPYFPLNEGDTILYELYQVKCTKKIVNEEYIVRSFTLVWIQERKKPHTLTHILCKSWGSQAPTLERFEEFFDYWNKCKTSNTDMRNANKMYTRDCAVSSPVIQSNAGMGRVGCFLIIDVISDLLRNNIRHHYNIEKMMVELKTELPQGISNLNEYKFVGDQVVWEIEKLSGDSYVRPQVTNTLGTRKFGTRNVERMVCSNNGMSNFEAIRQHRYLKMGVEVTKNVVNVTRNFISESLRKKEELPPRPSFATKVWRILTRFCNYFRKNEWSEWDTSDTAMLIDYDSDVE
ncbi:hypothetical protein GCK72_025011 [Caenorhabditis remanei]|uniref:Tyrosine-protein phosphatase domain-containing protein n=1 Tax=Caenorhabditis remanei TaxID=31234 RepID=A0A6A5G1P0_CAERE|nr:hypothetical protein GCK72_025011 [Caenorhabditis remanei]KAF1748544.1 hypothetical protein GCK72_025011 [Caenorhabditis remanei]